MTGEQDREAGLSLAEVLLALVIVGTAVSAVMWGVAAATRTSSVGQTASEVDAYLRAEAEAFRQAVQTGCSVSGSTTFSPAVVTQPNRGSIASPVSITAATSSGAISLTGPVTCPARGTTTTVVTLTASANGSAFGQPLKVALQWW